MFLADITYIKKCNRQTIIKHKNSFETFNKTINAVLDEICLTNMSTLNGRIIAAKSLLHINKNIPVYVKPDLILVPLFSKRHWDQVYINGCLVKEIICKDTNESIINFYDDSSLNVELNHKKLMRLIENSLEIRETFIYERGKY